MTTPQRLRELAETEKFNPEKRAVLLEYAALLELEPVATVYTMEALVPGGQVKHHASLLRPLPSGTALIVKP